MLQLLQARTPAAADSALAGLRDGVGQAVAEIRDGCVALLAELEVRGDERLWGGFVRVFVRDR